ncbi:hypothetical protein ACHAWU_004095 [Discostella pseudostelligera]|uniref:Uncharacterized protein n=1 Tax=Discostella pseudostelligera TaxID=259834 RepID=A0ABD3MK54_9STRA
MAESAPAAAAATLTHHDAFLLDIHTLSLLLHRNKYQHRRCIYYRRASMVLTALTRSLPSYQDVVIGMGQWKDMMDRLMISCRGAGQKVERIGRVKEEHWTLEHGDDDHDTTNKILTQDDDGIVQTQVLLQQMMTLQQQLKLLTTQSIPQILSRILYATPPILHEISRGYFVPFHTVAIACLGRIHSLVMKLGRELVTVLRETVPQLRDLLSKETDKRIIMDRKKLHDLIMSPFVIDAQYKKKNSTDISTTNEWNALMEHFIDANQDEITKQMNDYVKQKRWECAMRKLGLGKNVSTLPLVEQQLQSDDNNEDISGECEDISGSHDEGRNQLVRDDEDIPYGDMGELVSMQLGHEDISTQPTASLEDVVDENMARIIKGKLDRQIASKSAATSAEMSKSKKRKKKKKRREHNSIVDDIVAQGIAEQTSQQHHSDDADRTKPTDVATIRSDSTLSDRLDRPKEVVAASAIALASNDGVPNQAQQLMDESKSKVEKVKRKTKKKRKSTSVIDDIFGF